MVERSIERETRVADAIVGVLADAGIEWVVGIPGGHTGTLFQSLYQHPSIGTVLVREESIGTGIAEAYGRLTGRPVAVIGQGAWIVGNAGQAVLESLTGCSPMIILTDMTDAGALSHHGPYQDGTGSYGAWDAVKALEAVCKQVLVARYPAQAVQQTQLALKHALTGEQGPAAVVLGIDSLRGRLTKDSMPAVYPVAPYLSQRDSQLDPPLLDEVAGVLGAAHRPVVLAGNGVRVGQARTELAELARTLSAPVVTTASGKGVFPETDSLSGGVVGTFGWPEANKLLAEADVVLAVGTKLGPTDTCNEHQDLLSPERQTIVQIDIEPLNVGWTYPIDHAIVGDAGVQMQAISSRLSVLVASPRQASGEDRVIGAHDQSAEQVGYEHDLDGGGIPPRQVIEALGTAVPDDVIVTCDAGENRLFMMRWFHVPSGGDYLQPAGIGGMSYAVSAALGARLAHPDRPVVAVCGDGGFGMSLHALMTAVEEDLPITVVVLNNKALGWVLNGMGERAIAARLADFDLAAIAAAIGCESTRVDTIDGMVNAFAAIPGIERPYVIDVHTSLATSFKHLASPLT